MTGNVIPNSTITHANATTRKSMAAQTGNTLSDVQLARRVLPVRRVRLVQEGLPVPKVFPESEVLLVPKVLPAEC